MIIGDNFVFIHVCKTAGSSFEDMMLKRHGLRTYREQHNIAGDIPAEDRGKFIFGFLRDPLMAEVSNWRYHWYSWKQPPSMTFENWCLYRFVKGEEKLGDSFEITDGQRQYAAIFNVKPSAGFFCDWDGHCIADHIYRYEDLGPALEDISDRIGLNCSLEGFQGMTYGWSRGREDYMQHVTDDAREILERYKEIDVMLHRSEGDVPTNYTFPVCKSYCNSPK